MSEALPERRAELFPRDITYGEGCKRLAHDPDRCSVLTPFGNKRPDAVQEDAMLLAMLNDAVPADDDGGHAERHARRWKQS